MVIRSEAAHVFRSANLDITEGDPSHQKVCNVLKKAKQLGSHQSQLLVAELATHIWLNYIRSKEPFYPAFEAFTWSHFAGKAKFEPQMCRLIATGQVGADVITLYSDYLRSIFQASGKTRRDFYKEMVIEANAQADLESPELGE